MLIKRVYSKNQCVNCKHLLTNSTCKAFPNRIPTIIRAHLVNHNEIIKGQTNGFIYEPTPAYLEKHRKPLNFNKGKEILTVYNVNKQRLPKLVLKEVEKLNYDLNKIDQVILKVKIPDQERGIVQINLPSIEKSIILENLLLPLPPKEIFVTIRIISLIEKVINKTFENFELIIYNEVNYEYSNLNFWTS